MGVAPWRHHTARRKITEGGHIHTRLHENLKCHPFNSTPPHTTNMLHKPCSVQLQTAISLWPFNFMEHDPSREAYSRSAGQITFWIYGTRRFITGSQVTLGPHEPSAPPHTTFTCDSIATSSLSMPRSPECSLSFTFPNYSFDCIVISCIYNSCHVDVLPLHHPTVCITTRHGSCPRFTKLLHLLK